MKVKTAPLFWGALYLAEPAVGAGAAGIAQLLAADEAKKKAKDRQNQKSHDQSQTPPVATLLKADLRTIAAGAAGDARPRGNWLLLVWDVMGSGRRWSGQGSAAVGADAGCGVLRKVTAAIIALHSTVSFRFLLNSL